MAGQVNVRISDELEAFLDVWAVEEGRSRADLIRDIVTEGADARREGRLRFAKPDLPSPAELSRLTVRLDLQTGEMDRLLTSLARHEKRLTDTQARLAGTEEQVKKRLLDETIDKIRTAFEPFRSWFEHIDKTLAGHPAMVTAQVVGSPALAGLSERLDRIEAYARKPRVETHIDIGNLKLSWVWASLLVFITLVVGGAAWLLAGLLLPNRIVAFPAASMMLGGGDRAACLLLEYQRPWVRCVDNLSSKLDAVAAHPMVHSKPGKHPR